MGRSTDDDDACVRLSSKGQLVVPARIRRRLGWVAGRTIRLKVESNQQLTLSLIETSTGGLADMLMRARTWASASRRDLVEELDERRREERRREAIRAHRGH